MNTIKKILKSLFQTDKKYRLEKSRRTFKADGGGLEMLCMQIYEDREGSVLVGGFEILSYIETANKAYAFCMRTDIAECVR